MPVSFRLIWAALFFVISTNLPAQKKISFGKVSEEEIKMTSYDKDTTAGAVILSDVGKFYSVDLQFRRHLRIKVLKKSGLSWGNWVFNTPSKGDFKVYVFNLVNGEIKREKAESSSIYNEKVIDDFEVYKVFAPNVQVGSVIDISYSHQGLPFEWRFQEQIPIVHSNLVLEQNQYFQYTKTSFGFEPIQAVSPTEWLAKDMPAFKTEQFLNHYTNYITKFEIQLTGVNIPGYIYRDFSSSWQKVNAYLLESDNFGDALSSSGFLNEFARELKAKPISAKEKITEAYEYVRKNIKWNGSQSAFVSAGYRKNFIEDHTGNSADINIALIALLNKVDINTLPVVLSTRENGLLIEVFPMLNRLNYVVALVRHEGIEMMLDGTSESVNPDMLPYRCLNGRGLIVKEDRTEWIDLNRNNRYSKKQFINIDMKSDGTVSAKIDQTLGGYAFFDWLELKKQNSNLQDIQKAKYQKNYSELEILSYNASDDRQKYNAVESLQLDISNQLIDAGDEYLFNPIVLFEHTSNPFKEEDRKYPVDFGYAQEFSSTVVVQLPKEYVVKKLPTSVRFTNASKSAEFTFLTSANDKGLSFRIVLKLNSPVYTEDDYKDLRTFFSEVLKSVNTPVQLSKV